MEPWVKLSLILCIYGVLKEFRPAEPFITKFLREPPRNFTIEEINVEIYPIAIYSSMFLLVIVFLITDLVRYKPIIIINSLACIGVYTMLVTCHSLLAMQILEVLYGFIVACEVAYYTYIYAKVDKEHYQEVSGFTRAAYLIGRCISGIASQTLVLCGFSYLTLSYATLGGMCVSLVWAVMLPSVDRSIYFHNRPTSNQDKTDQNLSNFQPSNNFLKQGMKILWDDFVSAYTNIYLVKWAFWWAIATCAYYQVLSYHQSLWEQIIKDNNITGFTSQLNGAVEATYTILSAMAAFFCGKLKVDWSIFGESVLTLGSFIIAALLYSLSQMDNIWVSHGLYIIYTIVFNGIITIATSEIAKHVKLDSHALVFGVNLFIALAMQSLLTFIVLDTLKCEPRTQFVIYSCYYCVAGTLYGLKTLITCCKKDVSINTLQ